MKSQYKFNQKAIAWRRSEILRLLSQGYSQVQCAEKMKLDPATVSLDCKWIREQAKETIRKFLDERLPEEVQRAFVSYDLILFHAWQVANSSVADKRTKLNALSLAKDTLAAKLDLASNVDVVSHVMDLAGKRKDQQEKQAEETSASEHDEDTDIMETEEDTTPTEQDEDLREETQQE
jgi:hypothetical protein